MKNPIFRGAEVGLRKTNIEGRDCLKKGEATLAVYRFKSGLDKKEGWCF